MADEPPKKNVLGDVRITWQLPHMAGFEAAGLELDNWAQLVDVARFSEETDDQIRERLKNRLSSRPGEYGIVAIADHVTESRNTYELYRMGQRLDDANATLSEERLRLAACRGEVALAIYDMFVAIRNASEVRDGRFTRLEIE